MRNLRKINEFATVELSHYERKRESEKLHEYLIKEFSRENSQSDLGIDESLIKVDDQKN